MPRPGPRDVVATLAIILSGAACAPGDSGRNDAPPATPVTLVDGLGRQVILDGPADRVVSLVPSATLTLDALGARNVLVGRTDFDTVGWAADVPSVGGGLQPSLEAVVALQPDVVILFGGEQDPVTPGALDAVGIPWVGIRPDRIQDVLDIVQLLGRLTGREGHADVLADSLRAGLDRVRAGARMEVRPRVAYVLGGTPPWVAGPGTYIHELIELAGGRNVFDDLSTLYASVSPEEFVSRQIDVVLVSHLRAFDTRLAPGARVESVGASVELPGPGMVDAAREVAEAIGRGGA